MHSGSSVGVHGYQESPRELGNHARMRRSIRYTDDPNLKRVGRTMSYISDIRSRGLPPLFSIQTFLSYSNVVYSLSLSLFCLETIRLPYIFLCTMSLATWWKRKKFFTRHLRSTSKIWGKRCERLSGWRLPAARIASIPWYFDSLPLRHGRRFPKETVLSVYQDFDDKDATGFRWSSSKLCGMVVWNTMNCWLVEWDNNWLLVNIAG